MIAKSLKAVAIIFLFFFVFCENKSIEKDPILSISRNSSDNGIAFDLDIRGKRLYISDGDKLINYNISEPEKPINKVVLERPQGVIASYIHQKYLFEVTGGKSIRISTYNRPSKVIALIDQFKTDTKIEFFNNYAFVGSSMNIIAIRLKDPIEIFKYTSFLVNVYDIGVIGNILVVTLYDGSFKIYDLRDLSEPTLIKESTNNLNVKHTLIASSEKYLFVVEENQKNTKYIVKQVNIKNLSQWREMLLSYEKITKIYIKDNYFGVVRNDFFLDIYSIEKDNRFVQVLSAFGNISDFDIYKDYVYVGEWKKNNFLTIYKLN